jgi:hypothetical protein
MKKNIEVLLGVNCYYTKAYEKDQSDDNNFTYNDVNISTL